MTGERRAIEGVITAMVTPFADDLSLDLEGARRLAAGLVEDGSHGVVVAGTTGESATLEDDEVLRLLEAVLEEIGDEALVIAGTGSNDTRHAVSLTERAAGAGAHACLVVTPYYNKPNEAGLRAHFAAVAGAAGATPVVLYNIPGRSVINLGPELIRSLGADLDNVVAVKQANRDELEPVEGVALLAGDDDVFLRCLEVGGVGGILVASNLVPAEMRAIYDAATDGDLDRARALDEAVRPLYAALPVAPLVSSVKAMLEERGTIGGALRLPMVPATDAERERVREALQAVVTPA